MSNIPPDEDHELECRIRKEDLGRLDFRNQKTRVKNSNEWNQLLNRPWPMKDCGTIDNDDDTTCQNL